MKAHAVIDKAPRGAQVGIAAAAFISHNNTLEAPGYAITCISSVV